MTSLCGVLVPAEWKYVIGLGVEWPGVVGFAGECECAMIFRDVCDGGRSRPGITGGWGCNEEAWHAGVREGQVENPR